MQSVAVSFPLRPGQYDRIRDHHQDVVSGGTAAANLEHWLDIGLKTMKVYYQTHPAEALVLYFEADDLAYVFDADAHGRKPVHIQWVEFFKDVSGFDAVFSPPEVLIDWNHKEGHKQGTG